MHLDIVEAIRQKQQRQPKRIVIPNGDILLLPQFDDENNPEIAPPATRASKSAARSSGPLVCQMDYNHKVKLVLYYLDYIACVRVR